MKNEEVLRLVEALHRERRLDKETIFRGIEAALLVAARRRFEEPDKVEVKINRETGEVQVLYRGEVHRPEELGRIAAHISRQTLMQKIREAERERLYDEYADRVGELVQGNITRTERGFVAVDLGSIEAILPRSEQMPRERFRVGRRVRAIIKEVRRDNNRLRIVLSRTHPDFIRRLFEREVPEIQENVIQIKGVVREPGMRAKVAVASVDSRIDCVGACVGVRGSRIKSVLDELGGEKIDIVRWNEQPQHFIASALQPAEVKEVMLFPALGRAIVLVREDQLSQAIGYQGLNVRLASRLTGWEIEIMTEEELEAEAQRALIRFTSLEGVTADLADRLIEQGILSYSDLLSLGPQLVAELLEIPAEQAAALLEQAKEKVRAGEDPAELAARSTTPEEPPAAAEQQGKEEERDQGGLEGGAEDAGVGVEEGSTSQSEQAGGEGSLAAGEAEPATGESEPVSGAGAEVGAGTGAEQSGPVSDETQLAQHSAEPAPESPSNTNGKAGV